MTSELECDDKNFPFKCFYSEDEMSVFSFYRQGQALTIPIDVSWSSQPISNSIRSKGTIFKKQMESRKIDPNDYMLEQITDQDLGQMFLVHNKALVARCSSKILFFKHEFDNLEGIKKWKLYHEIDARGFIYFIKGNIRI